MEKKTCSSFIVHHVQLYKIIPLSLILYLALITSSRLKFFDVDLLWIIALIQNWCLLTITFINAQKKTQFVSYKSVLMDQFEFNTSPIKKCSLRLCISYQFGSNIRVEIPIWIYNQYGMRSQTHKKINTNLESYIGV